MLHSIPPKTSQKPPKPYQSTTVSKHAKYDKVPTQEINTFSASYEIINTKRKVPKFYKVIQQTFKKDEMGIDNQSQMKQNMSQIFSMEEPIKPNKELLSKTSDQDRNVAKEKTSLWPQVSCHVIFFFFLFDKI